MAELLTATAKNFGYDLNRLDEAMTSQGKERSQQRGFNDQKINDIT
ncbi:MAG: hypothetical protein K0S61_4177 [Anaerocolumna sp.]|jgi:hypothetical protein|nr:hypothetical protein [Anaerocolumna sp.]